MKMDELKNRKTTRLKGADYNRNQAVFLTICTKERRCVLSRIVGTVEDAGYRRTVRTMMSICDIFMKTLYGGITTNYTQRNKGYGLCPCAFVIQRRN